MDKKAIEKAVEEAKKNSKKREFKQTVDLIINLKDLDLKQTEHQIEFFITLPNPPRKNTVCAFLGPELADQGKQFADKVITIDRFPTYVQDKKAIKKLAQESDVFMAQANIMTDIAKVFGRVLGPRGKMPNPKSGAVVPANIPNLKPTIEKLKTQIKISAKIQPSIKLAVGKEDTENAKIIDNITAVYSQLVQSLPNEENNVKNMLVKLTMGPTVKVASEVMRMKLPTPPRSNSEAENK